MTPAPDKIQLDMEQVKQVGDLKVDMKKSVREYGKVIAVGPEVRGFKEGDTVLVKAWAVDTITYNDKDYFFVSVNSDGICAVITNETPTK